MRSADLTAAASIRRAALSLFAQRGVDGVSVRDVAAAAGVSPALVIHHYGSKDGLRIAVDADAGRLFGDLLTSLERPDSHGSAALMAAFAESMDSEPVLLAYLRRSLLEGGSAGQELFRRLFDVTLAGLASLQATGVVSTTTDDIARAAFLLVNDLGLLLLRDNVAAVIGGDPLSGPGMVRWAATVMDVYQRGVFVDPTEGGAK